uniref:Uncharacterized protein n=1 Tax=Amphimedon queenslandica TaxID=400682 RepID=A0A1X7UNI2_AMPQE
MQSHSLSIHHQVALELRCKLLLALSRLPLCTWMLAPSFCPPLSFRYYL